MTKDEVAARITALNLPLGQYVVVGGAAMTLRGIRETHDVDLVVTPWLFGRLRDSGWLQKPRPNGDPALRMGCFEAYLSVNTPSASPTIQQLIAAVELVDGVPVVDIATLMAWKREYGRDKDSRDVELLETFQREGQ